MYLTRFRMNPRKRGTLRMVESPQRMHAAILSTLPPDRALTDDGRVLWRLDQPSNYEWNLYIASPGRPSLEPLQDDCGWSQEQSWSTADYQPFLTRLAEGQRWAFRLTANPVRSLAGMRGERGSVKPHVTAEQQRLWLLDKAAKNGFALAGDKDDPMVRVTRRERDHFERGHGAERRRATVSRAQFDGVLEVTDPELIRAALVGGIGRAKAYGCGLMTLASVT